MTWRREVVRERLLGRKIVKDRDCEGERLLRITYPTTTTTTTITTIIITTRVMIVAIILTTQTTQYQ